jgi:hypothetical protein
MIILSCAERLGGIEDGWSIKKLALALPTRLTVDNKTSKVP